MTKKSRQPQKKAGSGAKNVFKKMLDGDLTASYSGNEKVKVNLLAAAIFGVGLHQVAIPAALIALACGVRFNVNAGSFNKDFGFYPTDSNASKTVNLNKDEPKEESNSDDNGFFGK